MAVYSGHHSETKIGELIGPLKLKKHPAYNIFNTSVATCWRLFSKTKVYEQR